MAVFDDMRRYVDSADRTSPLVFVGRQRELERLDATIVNVAERGTEGATTVVSGVPGAGKTALARELAKRWAGREVDGRPVSVVRLGVGALDATARDFAATLLRHLPLRGALPKSLQTVATRAFSGGARGACPSQERAFSGGARGACPSQERVASTTVAALSRQSSVELLHRSLGLVESSGLRDCLDAYGALWAKDATIVLAVDEFQAIPITEKSRQLVRELHENTGNHRIVLLAFGLHNAMDVLTAEDGLNLSRLRAGASIPLGALAPGEGREAIAGTLQALGLQWENDEWRAHLRERGFALGQWRGWRERLVAALDREAANFPHHLTNASAAACALLLREREAFSPGRDLIDEMLAELDDRKSDYYDARLGQLREHALALGALAATMVEERIDTVMRTEARGALATADNDGDEVTPDAAERLLATAIRRGIFSPASAGGLAFTIPSMTAHLGRAFETLAAKGDEVALAVRGAIDVSKSVARFGGGRSR